MFNSYRLVIVSCLNRIFVLFLLLFLLSFTFLFYWTQNQVAKSKATSHHFCPTGLSAFPSRVANLHIFSPFLSWHDCWTTLHCHTTSPLAMTNHLSPWSFNANTVNFAWGSLRPQPLNTATPHTGKRGVGLLRKRERDFWEGRGHCPFGMKGKTDHAL